MAARGGGGTSPRAAGPSAYFGAGIQGAVAASLANFCRQIADRGDLRIVEVHVIGDDRLDCARGWPLIASVVTDLDYPADIKSL
jgi:hypothetical protein